MDIAFFPPFKAGVNRWQCLFISWLCGFLIKVWGIIWIPGLLQDTLTPMHQGPSAGLKENLCLREGPMASGRMCWDSNSTIYYDRIQDRDLPEQKQHLFSTIGKPSTCLSSTLILRLKLLGGWRGLHWARLTSTDSSMKHTNLWEFTTLVGGAGSTKT